MAQTILDLSQQIEQLLKSRQGNGADIRVRDMAKRRTPTVRKSGEFQIPATAPANPGSMDEDSE